MIAETDTVAWTRKESTGRDARGNPTVVDAVGFPVVASGCWQEKERSRRTEPAGNSVEIDAVFHSSSFTTGAVSDRVTYNGKVYIVVNAKHRHRATSTSSFYSRYELKRGEPGG